MVVAPIEKALADVWVNIDPAALRNTGPDQKSISDTQ